MLKFEWNGGTKLLGKPIWFDGARYGEITVVTSARVKNAHRHKKAICTDITFSLLHWIRPDFQCLKLPFSVGMEVGGVRLCLYPSGFMPGSALVLIEAEDKKFLFVNRVVLDTIFWEKAVVPKADVLVVVTPYGSSNFAFVPRREIYDMIVDSARHSIEVGQNPVFFTSAVGKAQELTRVLSANGFEVVVHRTIARVCEAYKAIGVDAGRWKVFRGRLTLSQALVYPDHLRRSTAIRNLGNPRIIWLSGIAMDRVAKESFGADEAFCLSGYPDISGLLKLVGMSNPKMVYVVGEDIDDALVSIRKKGVEAHPIRWKKQLSLF